MKDTNLIIGKINSGKTKGILFKEVKKSIEKKENLFILDSRGEYYKTFGKELKNNYNTYVININNPINSNGWNPLRLPYNYYKNGEMDKCISCIKNLTLELFKEDNLTSDPFWANTASDYVAGLILFLFKEGKEEEINIGSIGTLLTQGTICNNDKTLLQEYLTKIDIMDPIYTFLSVTEFAPPETKGSILSVIRQKLNTIYVKDNLLNMLSINELDLTNISDNSAIIVIGDNVIANILLDQIVYSNNKKFNFIIDNVENYSNILALKELVENASYNKLKLSVSTRDLSECEYKYGKYTFNKFQNIINIENELELIEEGNYNDYPKINIIERRFFNLEEFMKNK